MRNSGWDMPRCSECGRFCHPKDGGVPYGHAYDMEPPDPIEYCPSCADKKMERAILEPEKIISGCWWIKPNYVRVARCMLRRKRTDARKDPSCLRSPKK